MPRTKAAVDESLASPLTEEVTATVESGNVMQPTRSIRASKDTGPTQFSKSMKAFKFLDVLDMAYKNGFLGFFETLIEPVQTLNRQGQPHTTWVAMVKANFREDDGTERSHVGWGEANYENCGSQVGNSAMRMAETRAQGRALARALNLDANFDYEMSDPERPQDSAIPNSGSGYNSRSSGGSSPKAVVATVDPATFPPQNAPDGWVCESCGDAIPDTTRADGSPYPAGQKAAYSVKHFAQVLCATHMRAAKEAQG